MKLFTLLHLQEGETSLVNAVVDTYQTQIRLYSGCIRSLHASLAREQIELAVLTNKPSLVHEALEGYPIDVIELAFSMHVPLGINFYADHFKAEVYQYFSTLTEEYVGLLDNDVVCISPLPVALKNAIGLKMPLYYDITDQVFPAYGPERVIRDKQLVSTKNSVGLWAGGEFIMGPPAFFAQLHREIISFIDQYYAQHQQLHHQSVEFLTSVAIENLLTEGRTVVLDAGRLGIIARYWSIDTLHMQKPFDAYADSFLLHLPADKKILAQPENTAENGLSFVERYKSYLKRKRHRELLGAMKRKLLFR